MQLVNFGGTHLLRSSTPTCKGGRHVFNRRALPSPDLRGMDSVLSYGQKLVTVDQAAVTLLSIRPVSPL
jgi:hypothetical protein